MLFEMPTIETLTDAENAFTEIVDAMIHMQYSGRYEGRNNSSRSKNKNRLNSFSDEFQALCNTRAKRTDKPKEKAKWIKLREDMAKEKISLNNHKEVIMGQDGVY